MSPKNQRLINRRRFLADTAGVVAGGTLGLQAKYLLAAEQGGGHPLAPRRSHFAPRAERLIFIFLTGGMSHVDTFDYKPALERDKGKTLTGINAVLGTQYLIPSRYQFRRHGRSGIAISELFPHIGNVADDLCVINSMYTDHLEHFEATLAMHTGSTTVPLPSMGSWLSHALGTFNPNLPSYMLLAKDMPYAGAQNWDSNFLPAQHQGVRLVPGPKPIPNLSSPTKSVHLRELEERMLRDFNQMHAGRKDYDPSLLARMGSFETAKGMMEFAPEAMDVASESSATRNLYGLGRKDNQSFAWQCLVARRLSQRGVRVVELFHAGSDLEKNWDNHEDVGKLSGLSRQVDQPIAALIQDLKGLGMLDDTLVVIATEFGRTPYERKPDHQGRNHLKDVFTCMLAGGGVKAGFVYGKSDEHGIEVAEDGVHVHDLHATILHLMGLDHTRLTYHYGGRDFRLTDVHGKVLGDLIA